MFVVPLATIMMMEIEMMRLLIFLQIMQMITIEGELLEMRYDDYYVVIADFLSALLYYLLYVLLYCCHIAYSLYFTEVIFKHNIKVICGLQTYTPYIYICMYVLLFIVLI